MSYSNADTGDKPANPAAIKSNDDIPIGDKVLQLSEFMDKCKFAMMTTRVGSTGQLVSRCMALSAKETGGIDPLFFTNTESGKTDDVASDPSINISFLDVSGQWASISGVAEISTDRALISKHYTPALKAWLGDLGDGTHDGGPNDPRVGAINVKAKTITYSVYEKGIFGRAVEYAKGAATGEVPGYNKIREITESEIEAWRKEH
ncbi:MAG: hypothetical protein MMC23_006946 [Stictis urceolatum]|nr:hypothetical protein [Stictis urceolata]